MAFGHAIAFNLQPWPLATRSRSTFNLQPVTFNLGLWPRDRVQPSLPQPLGRTSLKKMDKFI
ncbi:MAG: hypothetical protein F6K55_11775 [Moorea sp. SIO4A3]|nr:hypothetical protein [Moorena sp. SIO4A3]